MSINYRNELNPEQYDAVMTTEGPLLILAAAGTGKTRTLIYRVAHLVESGVIPEKILLLTFTNKAADEMKARAAKMSDARCEHIHASTYHSFCAMLLRKYAKYANLPSNYTIITPSDTDDAISLLEAEHNFHKLKGFPKVSHIRSMISASINRQIPLATILDEAKYQKYAHYFPQLQTLDIAYQEYKKDRGLVDYDDMLLKTYEVLKNCSDVREHVESSYDYIMVDEYQDTNWLQDQIVFLIRQKNRNLAVVGDDMQSLYGFRGADVQNIISFEDRIPDCKVVKLVRNYRSNQEILDLANDVVAKNATEGFRKDMIGTYSANFKPKLIRTFSSYREVDAAMFLINRLHNQEHIPYKEICVLGRSSFSTNMLEAALVTQKIEYNKYGGWKFFDRPHVQDLMAMFRCVANPTDELAYFRALQMYYMIGKVNARQIASGVLFDQEVALLKEDFKSRIFGQSLLEYYQKIQEWRKMELEPMIQDMANYYHAVQKDKISKMKLKTETERKERQENNDAAKEDLLLIPEMAKGYTTMLEFLDAISIDQNTTKDSDALVISTIHSAKGLEFNSVIIMDCADTVFPSTSIMNAGSKEDNEELRCFYVAITRAKENLYMLYPVNAVRYGRSDTVNASHYLSGLSSYEEEEF